MTRLTRRSLLALLPIAAAGVDARFIEPRWLEVTHTRAGAGLLPRPIKILHLSDLHASASVPLSHINHAFELGLAGKPDLICLTGDYVTTNSDYDEVRYRTLLKRLSSAAPVYAVLGNHDGGLWAGAAGWFSTHQYIGALLESAGINVLHNRAVNAGPVWLAGLGDWWSNESVPDLAYANIPPGQPLVLLNHNPDGKKCLGDRRFDLMLCGHTHGGQVRVPLYGSPIAPIEDKRFVAGLNRYKPGQWIYTSRGVGNIDGVRFNCRPEVGIIQFG